MRDRQACAVSATEALAERGLLVRKGMTSMPIREYRCTSYSRGDYAWRTCWYKAIEWRITSAGREAVAEGGDA